MKLVGRNPWTLDKVCQNPFNNRKAKTIPHPHDSIKKAEAGVLVNILGEVAVMGAYRDRVCKAWFRMTTKPSLSPPATRCSGTYI